MATDNGIICKSRAAASAALETIAASMPRGTQRDALLAVKNWIEENLPPDFDEETIKKIQRIYEGTEEQKKGRAWLDNEMEDPAYVGRGSDHHEFIHEPENGAELDCYYSAKYEKWIPVGYGWPPVLHQTDGFPGEGEES
jgi:hypothetical protein